MSFTLHKSEERGHQNHGWLIANHSFSFASYQNTKRMHFGVLRVLNDDFVEKGMGFGTHPHSNMEIITIPLSGELQHKDSMGNFGSIKKGEIQVMSAGSGVEHSEFNGSLEDPVTMLQIWIIPNKMEVEPRYDQISINQSPNELHQILSPNPDDAGSWIHQDAWFHLGNFNKTSVVNYDVKKNGNGIFVFVINGSVEIESQVLNKRDALAITNVENFEMKISENSEILIMDIPMILPKLN
ncbi:pirin family protein [Frigoriflavimonas asaccharolytica]|uniref:Pirin family protein n=1 Tax=Frigoriflavimonas asaccharolytica TaxID=2735899 RepID=A0A8J8G5X9_9FLAO|nr:pirin family protein [Frigoriflavimonas asaccharolytica]NRS91839.1 hypothetical protein [Frigoriflavimonas asaccharolytica]